MNIQVVLILFLLILTGCNKYHYPLSQLTVNDKSKNGYIIHRKPDYGDGHRDGCIFMNEISMNLTLNKNQLSGNVFDSESNDKLNNANIKIVTTEDTLNISANNDGYFSSVNGDVNAIDVEYVGYRALRIALN